MFDISFVDACQSKLNMADTEFLISSPHLFFPQACDLGVIFNLDLHLDPHIQAMPKSCRFSWHNISKMPPFLFIHVAKMLIQALTISHLD